MGKVNTIKLYKACIDHLFKSLNDMMVSKRRVLSIDVECFASGYGHDERVPCSVAVVDEQCQIIFSSLIKAEKIVSDLFPFSGLRKTDIDQAPTYEEVIRQVSYL